MTSGQNPRGFSSLFSGRHFAAACLAALSFFATGVASGQKNAAWEQDLSTWRVQHAADLQKPDGWLALAGLVWLDGGDNSMGSSADSKVRLPESAPVTGRSSASRRHHGFASGAGGRLPCWAACGWKTGAGARSAHKFGQRQRQSENDDWVAEFLRGEAGRSIRGANQGREGADSCWISRIELVSAEFALSRHGEVDSVQSAEDDQAGDDDRDGVRRAGSGSGGISTRWEDIPARACDGRQSAGKIIFYFEGHDERDEDLRSVPISLHAVAARRTRQTG